MSEDRKYIIFNKPMDYRRGTAGKKRVRGAGAENKSSAGHRIRWDHDEWRAPGIVCEGSEGGRL